MLRAIKQVKRVFLFNWLEFSRDIQKERIKQQSEVSRVDIQIRVIKVSNFNLFSYCFIIGIHILVEERYYFAISMGLY